MYLGTYLGIDVDFFLENCEKPKNMLSNVYEPISNKIF